MRWTRRKFIKALLLTSAGVVAADTFWFEKIFIEINEFFIGKKTGTDKGIKIIQLSDLHIKSLSDRLVKLARQLNEFNPDIIVFTGDSLDKTQSLDLLNDFLKLLRHDIPKVAVPGNWDYWSKVGIDNLKAVFEANNCDLLINQNKQYTVANKTITFTGLDDFIAGDPNIDIAVKEIPQSDYHIVLNHCPEYTSAIIGRLQHKIPYNLILSGHTHGGQINLFGLILYKPPGSGKYLKGWYENDTLYISRGIGTSSFPGRFLCRPEVAIFNIA